MDTSGGYEALQQKISANLVATTRSASQLAAEDLDFLRASDKKAGKRVDRKNGQLLGLAQQILTSSTQGTSLVPPELKKPSQVDDHWRSIADVIDNLLERADRCLDEYTGVITKLSKEKEQAIQERSTTGRREGKASRVHPLEKPQLRFKRIPKNDETTPFKPLLSSKPNATVPLEDCLQLVKGEDGSETYNHPYEQEITRFKYPSSVYSHGEPILPNEDSEGRTLTWVDTPEKVGEMLQELRQAEEIAVDLEHHDTHTYTGLVCLMQISTRQRDWIVDTLKPWREELQVLNEVFTDPKILKVFHGSTMDIIWLQRDLGLYVVGLFDTYHATVALNYPRHGLAFLLKKFEDFDAQKQYQMADWRTRPLSKEMTEYARSDTHYLLHVYDQIRNELVENSTKDSNLVDYVLERSKEEALQKYERFFYDENYGLGAYGWLGLLLRTPASLSNEQFAVFRAVHRLRDQIARRADESLLAVMRNDTIFAIARTMPEQMPELQGTISAVSQFLQPKMSELLATIKAAKAAGASGPSVDEVMNSQEVLAYLEKTGAARYRRRAERKPGHAGERKAATPALAEIIRTEREKMNEPLSAADSSMFWGDTLTNHTIASSEPQIRLQVPLPPLNTILAGDGTSSVIHDAAGANGITNDTPTKSPAPKAQPLKSTEASTFSIKQLKQQNRKRKAGEIEDAAATAASAATSAATSDREESENEDESGTLGDKKAAKKRKRSEKQLKLASQLAEQPGSDGELGQAALAERASTGSISKETYHKVKTRIASSRQGHSIGSAQLSSAAVSVGDEEEEGASSEAATPAPADAKKSKAQKKAEQRAKREADRKALQEETPFDYANAPNMLDGGAGGGDGGKGGKKQPKGGKKVYDPYAKALDTPKGLPRRNAGGGAGRSRTFKG